jgi:hypothetical protein
LRVRAEGLLSALLPRRVALGEALLLLLVSLGLLGCG